MSATIDPTLPSRPGAVALTPAQRIGIGIAFVAAWLAVKVIWGMTDAVDTTLSAWLRRLAPLPIWLAALTSALVVVAVAARGRGAKGLRFLVWLLLAYVLGLWAGELAQNWFAPTTPIRHRSFLLVPALPMLAVWWVFRRVSSSFPLRFGDWMRSISDTEVGFTSRMTWRGGLARLVLLIALPLFVVTWFSSGPAAADITVWSSLGGLLALSALNGLAEEVLFRGLILRGATAAVGARVGNWLQAVLFGFLHFGSSPEPIASLPVAIFLVGFGLLQGRSVLATGGIGWAACLHAVMNAATLPGLLATS